MRKTPTEFAHSRSVTRPITILTIGHSTRSIGTFIQMLQAYGVKRLVDVRTIPRSRHNPQFNRDVLPATLLQAGIGYTHMEELGGLRHARTDSLNTGWHNTSFRGFADYMQTSEFQTGIKTLIQAAKREQVAIMCAEAVPWRCHRSLIGDALEVRGIAVEDIMSENRIQAHELTSFARVKGAHVTYPAPDETWKPKAKTKTLQAKSKRNSAE
jgi:uncharacterized protein (DUF488 family)